MSNKIETQLVPFKLSIKTELKPFQIKTTQWMKSAETNHDGGLLLNEAGLGKSICILKTIVDTPSKTLIVCPAGVIHNWSNEIEKHTNIPKSRILVYHSPNRARKEITDDHLIFITSYTILAKEMKSTNPHTLFREVDFQRTVLDEAHYIRNANSNIFKGLHQLSERCHVNMKKWIVTATPIFNSPHDMFAYFKFLGLEGIDSKREWTRTITKSVSGLRTLNKWIEKYGISLKKKNVLHELQAKNEVECELEFTTMQNNFYEALRSYSVQRMARLLDTMRTLDNESMKSIIRNNVMVFILRLKQVCDSPLLVIKSMKRLQGTTNAQEAIERLQFYNESKESTDECPICCDTVADYIASPCGHKCCQSCWIRLFNAQLHDCPHCRVRVDEISPVNDSPASQAVVLLEDAHNSAKINRVQEITNDVLSKKEKVINVSQWVKMLDIMRNVFDKELPHVKYVSLQGDMSLNERTNAIQKFESDPNVQVAFVSLMASAEGINLVAANHLVLVDTWWNDAKMIQVMDRIHRIGQKKNVTIHKLQIANSIEINIDKLIRKKKRMTTLVMNSWTIVDENKYDDSWLSDAIVLLSEPNQGEAETEQVN